MRYIIDEVDIQSLLDARKCFEEFRRDIVTDRDRAGAIHAFEFTYEVAWKTMKNLLESKEVKDIRGSKDCFREAEKFGMISDHKIWLDFVRLRNMTSHTYGTRVMHEMTESLAFFAKTLNDFLLRIGYNE